ncbi:tandem-95 repeat protein [Agrobacterium tumefaciens]|uniref:Tandem-95 repeat protein n=2 Tax=Rhizobium/Agrobacterium group TaxID=227290 RepID=A0AAF0H4N5_AGRTU|nr:MULTISPECIES: tandem-95 repeat protein [Agrobacterium]WGM62265.1 tandem-95 repeat protein [Agrobacterium tumefaciens]
MLEDSYLDIDPTALMANDYTPEGTILNFVGIEGGELLENGKYRITPAANFNGELVLRYFIKNEQDFTVSTTVTINVLPVADAPVAAPESLRMQEDSPLALFTSQLLANDSDADLQAIVLSRILETSGVTVTDLGFGQLRITPDANYNGAAWFDYEIEDSTGRTATARVTIDISPLNDAPVIASIPVLKGTEDQRFNATFPATFVSDADGDALLVEVRGKGGVALPSWLQYDALTRTLSGDPPLNFNGALELEVVATDGSAQTIRDLIVSIAPVGDAPVLIAPIDDREIDEDQPFALSLPTGAFSDPDGDALTLAVTLRDGSALPKWMSVVAGALVGTPPANFRGVIELKLAASDGSRSASADLRFVVRAVNDAPVLMATAEDRSARGGEALAFNLDGGMFGDIDGDTLTITARLADGAALPAWLVFDRARFTGTPPRDYDGVLDIEVVATDGSLSVSDTFRLTVEPGNATPAVANPLADVMLPEDAAVLIGIPTGTFIDVDGDELTLSACLADGSALPNWLVFNGVSFTGMPPANFNGVFDIVVTASDGTLAASSSFRLTVAAVNDTPVVAVRLPDVWSPEDEPISFGIPAGSFVDVDGDALTLIARLADGSALPGWLAFKDLAFAGTPPANFNGAIDIEVLASDGVSSTASIFRLTITPVNDAPSVSTLLPDIVLPRNVQVSIPIAGEIFRDVDGDTLTVTARLSNGNPLPSWLSLSNGRLIGTPPSNLVGVFDIEVSASDGTLTTSDSFRLTIKATNAQPVVALPLPDVSSPEDTAVSLVIPTGSFVDPDGNPLIYTAKLSSGASLPAWLLFDGHTFKGMPPANFNGALDIRVTASDGSLSANDVFRLSIMPVNDAPMQAHPLSDVSVQEDGLVWITIPAGTFTDVDSSVLSYRARLADGSALPAWLRLSRTRFIGTPPANFNGVLDIVVTVSDAALTASGNFRLTIVPVNDAPTLVTALPDIFSLEDQPVSVTIPAGSFFDVDNDKLTYSAKLLSGAALPAWLSFDGQTFKGTPPTNFKSALDIRVTARDGALSANDVFRLTITPVNDAPVLVNPLADVTVQEDNAVSITFPYGSFCDVDSTRLTYTATLADGSALPTWLREGDSSLRGTPPANFNGELDIRVTASDGLLSASDVFRLTITPVNDRPVVATDGPISVVHNEVREIAIVGLLANDVDVDGDTLSIVSLNNVATGTVALGTDGFVRYTPDFGYQGNDSFTYTVSDGALTATGTVSLTVARAFEGWVQGTSAANIMLGGNGVANSLYGATGNDVIRGGDQADRLAGGAGTDTLYGYDGDDEFWGMDGNDTIYGGAGVDTAYFNGLKASYSIVTTGGTVKVTDNQTTVNGNDGVDTLSSVERLVFRNGETVTLAAPIVIDLDGAGIETVDAAQSSIMFDIDGDGIADRTSWIGKPEAFLFRDRNRDGVMRGIAEMSFIDEAAEVRSDLDGLRSLDSNGDGMISSKDARFGELHLWQDRNADGIAQADEVLSLTDAGIRSLDLGATAVESNWAFGSTIVVNQGTYTRTDGTQMRYADVVLTAVNGSKGAEVSAALASLALDTSRAAQAALGQFTASPSDQLQSWTSLLGAEPSGTATEGHDAQGGGDSARVLALMRQDMSTFGTKSGEGDANWRKADQLRPMDFFA